MRWTKRTESRLRVKNRHGQPLSNQGCMMGGVKAKNGVLELWSKGVMEARDAGPFCDAGPEASVPTKPRKRSQVGKGGQGMEKGTGFARTAPTSTRLGPDDSMQVVDFPHIRVAGVFWGTLKYDFQSQAVLGSNVGKPRGNGKVAGPEAGVPGSRRARSARPTARNATSWWRLPRRSVGLPRRRGQKLYPLSRAL